MRGNPEKATLTPRNSQVLCYPSGSSQDSRHLVRRVCLLLSFSLLLPIPKPHYSMGLRRLQLLLFGNKPQSWDRSKANYNSRRLSSDGAADSRACYTILIVILQPNCASKASSMPGILCPSLAVASEIGKMMAWTQKRDKKVSSLRLGLLFFL